MPAGRRGLGETCARPVTVPSECQQDTATPFVPRRPVRASAARRGSVERPRDGCPRPCAGSAHAPPNRRAVVPAAAPSDGSSIDGALRAANARLLPAGPTPTHPSTEATAIANIARTDGQRNESADRNERGRPAGGVGPEARGAGLPARTALTEAQRPAECRHTSRIEWPATVRRSTIFAAAWILANDTRFQVARRV